MAVDLKKTFTKASDMQKATAVDFAGLLDFCAKAHPKMRFRFSTSNPQDMSLDVIRSMAKHPNICNHVHLPVQSGSNRILKEMNRQHTREEYLDLINNIKDPPPRLHNFSRYDLRIPNRNGKRPSGHPQLNERC